MTDAYVTNTIKHLLHETHVRKAIEVTLSDMVFAVEQCAYEKEKEQTQHELQQVKAKFSEEAVKCSNLESANKVLQSHRVEMRQKATQAKEHFIVDISQVLRESRNIYSLRERLKEMDKKLLLTTRLESELLEAKKRIKELERQQEKANKKKQRNTSIGGDTEGKSSVAIASVKIVKVPHNLLVNVDDSFLMSAFSYLSTKDVIHTAQASRFLYKKVDTMFSIGSALCKQSDWGVLPARYTSQQQQQQQESSPPSALDPSSKKELGGGNSSGSSSSSGGGGIVGLTKQMAEELSKKLSAPELKTILSMMDNQKKLSSQLVACQAENAQRKEQLESTESARDFLLGKLQDAEFAIKSSMAEQATLLKQAETDHEVIFYLDTQSQELESENKELRWRGGQLQASLDLLRGSHTTTERQTLEELHEVKDRLAVSEGAARSQKKILVKEVKTLRAQLDGVRAERERYWRTVQVMRDTLSLQGTDNGGEGGSGRGGDQGAAAGVSVSSQSNKKSIASKVYSMKSSLF